MDKVILIEYGELSTKKGNRDFFVSKLKSSILSKSIGTDITVYDDLSRMVIEYKDSDEDKVKDIINHTFGIHAYHIAYRIDSNKDIIDKSIIDISKSIKFNTFKVDVKRSDKSFPINSMDYMSYLGSLILKNNDNIKVDVHNPDIIFKVEIRRNHTFIYSDKLYGLGGYPSGTQSTGLLMLSGGIDSPVAGYLAQRRGVRIECVYFEAIPHTSLEAREKVINLAKVLNKFDEVKLHVINFTPIQESIYKNCDKNYTITIMRRMMYRIMEGLSKKYNYKLIINGESLGQVASQTVESMYVINNVTNLPVIRPCSCLDKLEIIKISKDIDTYDISILPYEDCCTIYVPRHPVIRPDLDYAISEENKIDYAGMIEESINNEIIIDINDNSFSDIL